MESTSNHLDPDFYMTKSGSLDFGVISHIFKEARSQGLVDFELDDELKAELIYASNDERRAFIAENICLPLKTMLSTVSLDTKEFWSKIKKSSSGRSDDTWFSSQAQRCHV